MPRIEPIKRDPNLSEPLNVVPDLHADPLRLEDTLAALQDETPIVFLGDFIDAGSSNRSCDDRSVLTSVRSIIESGRGVGVMGNHELNAILFHRRGKDGQPLREHAEKNIRQHKSFIDQIGVMSDEAVEWTNWFLTLPLWREIGSARFVHACWDQDAIETIAARRPNGRLHIADLGEVAEERTAFGKAVNTLLCGPTHQLDHPHGFHDNSNHFRSEVRLAWWRQGATSWADAALSIPDPAEIAAAPFHVRFTSPLTSRFDGPVFVGHYKMDGSPRIEADQAICLDYPQAPCVYQWRGETTLTAAHLRAVSPDCGGHIPHLQTERDLSHVEIAAR